MTVTASPILVATASRCTSDRTRAVRSVCKSLQLLLYNRRNSLCMIARGSSFWETRPSTDDRVW
ncbi:hypothetical protein D8Y22_00770 [Salinadaptatus halalkaliphilus]|uniref:Uncharacterized protein n=1 Tax=Salinadaptatus halalkaliphilus TaxID=2419781 RepID=A0A4S3TQV8_9EURY|nr:hypothetical protein D8Y22_00770 [Salinadaptatus halalkaliphilus]